ncbi:MAG: ABC transporter permease subunit [Robiginitomaculum sp.]|nr:ABC transporter permease subunit [Robiginitomaculum sp.]MDQ7076735.1 ABC transporter permease subunit [Robiginitomaculum sp.]
MKGFLHTARLDISESLRARWFLLYALIFGAIVVILFVFGLSESRVRGFTGLSRLLVTYIQLTMAIMPLFVLITTVRSLAGDREAGVNEYMLSLPVSLGAWYWGRFAGRFVVIFLPVFVAMLGAVLWGALKGAAVPMGQVAWYSLLLLVLSFCFLGFGFLISAMARTTEMAQSAALLLWLTLLLFLDLILLGLLIKAQAAPELVMTIALLNPLEVFRGGAMILFDPQLLMLGPTAYLILDVFGRTGFMLYSVLYPIGLGAILALGGFYVFKRGDYP